LSVSPFNLPFYLTLQSAIGNIIAGNTSIVKPDENCAAVGELMNEIAAEADLASEF